MRALIAISLLLLAPAVAHAQLRSKCGPVTFQVPSGWTGSNNKELVRLFGPSGATIHIRHHQLGASACDVARAAIPADAKTELKAKAVRVAGRDGHLVVRRSADRLYAAAACMVDGEGVVFLLGAPDSVYNDCCSVWGALVENARIEGGVADAEIPSAEPATPVKTPPPAPAQAPASCEPAKHWIELRNIADWGTSTVYWDGFEYKLAPGEGRRVEATPGNHRFKWQNTDGSWGEGVYQVPKFASFKGSCPRPEPKVAEPEIPEAAAAGAPSTVTDEEALDLGRWWLNLMMLSVLTVKTADGNYPDEYVQRLQDANSPELQKIVRQIHHNRRFREFCRAIQDNWNEIVTVAKERTHARHYQMKRDMALMLNHEDGRAFAFPPADGGAGDDVDRLLRDQRRKWDEVRSLRNAARRQSATSEFFAQGLTLNLDGRHDLAMNIINDAR